MLDPVPPPPAVGRTEWQHARDQLLAREKAHTREGDAIAAAMRSLPMTPVAGSTVIGVDGPTPLIDVFEGRRMLIAYCFMWRCYTRDGDNVYLTYETNQRGTEVLDTALRLLDMTACGRQETWEESPPRWPQVPAGSWWRRDGRPVAQWARTSEPVANDRRETE